MVSERLSTTANRKAKPSRKAKPRAHPQADAKAPECYVNAGTNDAPENKERKVLPMSTGLNWKAWAPTILNLN